MKLQTNHHQRPTGHTMPESFFASSPTRRAYSAIADAIIHAQTGFHWYALTPAPRRALAYGSVIRDCYGARMEPEDCASMIIAQHKAANR